MKKGIAKCTAFVLAAGLTFGQGGTVLLAAGTDTALVGLGSTVKKTENAKSSSSAAEKKEEKTEEAPAAAPADALQQEEDHSYGADAGAVGTTGFAQCDDYLNIRSEASGESKVVGKVFNNGSVEILDADENGWYHIRSGNAEGYVAAQFIATGDEADSIAADTGYTTAFVGAELLNLRAEADEEAEIIGSVYENQYVEVVEDNGDWIKVGTDDGTYGYVSSDYVYTSTEYATGVTMEEDLAVNDQNWYDYMTAQATSPEDAYVSYNEDESYDFDESDTYDAAAYDPAYDTGYYGDDTGTFIDPSVYGDDASAYVDPSVYGYDASAYADPSVYGYDASAYVDPSVYGYDASAYVDPSVYGYDASAYTYTDPSVYGGTASYGTDLQSSAEALYQQYTDAQAAADAAVSDGADEQTVLDTASAAEDAYLAYLQAQNAADEASWGQPAEQYTYDGTAAAVQTDVSPAYTAPAVTYDQTYTDPAQTVTAPAENTVPEQTAAVTEPTADQAAAADTAAAAEAAAASTAGQQAADYAVQFVGNPYVWGGESLTNGADCSGFTMAVMNNFGVSLPHNAEAQSAYGTEVSMDDLQPGDLLFYGGDGGIGHVSMYIGNDQVVHASNPTNGILISDVGYRDAVSARRYLD